MSKKRISIAIASLIMVFAMSFAFIQNSYAQDIEDGEVIVTFKSDISVDNAEKATEGNVETLVSDSNRIQKNEPVLVTDDEKSTEEIITELQDNNKIADIQPNFRYTLCEDKKDTLYEGTVTSMLEKFEDDWNYRFMNVKYAWALINKLNLPKAERINIGIIDTGVDYNHADMQKNIDRETSMRVLANKIEPYTVTSQDNHGTKVASIIGADANNELGINGLAAGSKNNLVKLSCINVFDKGKREAQYSATTADLIAAMEYAKEHNAQILNMTFGAISVYQDYYGKEHDDKAIKKVIDKLTEKGIIIVSPAGNENTSEKCYISDFNNVISAIAIKKYTNAYKCPKKSSSNYGLQKTISAPGQDIPSCLPKNNYGLISASSAASAHVTSTIALMKVVKPDLTPAEAEEIICKTATDVYLTGKDKLTSSGVVNAYTAVREAALRYAKTGRMKDKNGNRITYTQIRKLTEELRPKSFGKKLSAPTIKSVTGYTKQLKLKWSYSYTGTVNMIKIYRRRSDEKSYKLVKTFNSKATTWTNSNLKSKKRYYYKVIVFCTSSDGRRIISPYSSAKSGVTK